MFSYVSAEQRVKADHPLRPIRKMVDSVLSELSPLFERLYAKTGRPSIPPEKLLRALLLQLLYTIRSERLLMEQLDYNMLFRWFVGLNMDDAVWAPTVFTKNRERLLEGVPFFPYANANRTVVVRTYGNPLAEGCTMQFASCQSGTSGVVLLYTIDFLLLSSIGETYFSILRHTTPSNPLFQCPVLILCNGPSSTRICCAGGQAILNGRPCTVAVEQKSWSQVKDLYYN